MTELLVQSPPSDAPSKREGEGLVNTCLNTLSHIAALVVWSYAIIKLFVYDVDNFIVTNYAPDFSWVIEFKFVIIIACISISLILFKKQRTLNFLLFLLFYPILIVFWHLPRYIWKSNNWMFIIVVMNTVFSFFSSFRTNFVAISMSIIAVTLICVFEDKYVLYGSSFIILSLIAFVFFSKIALAFRPACTVKIYEKLFAEPLPKVVEDQKLAEPLRTLTTLEMDPGQLKSYRGSLQTQVLYNRVCLFVATILRDYRKSGITAVSGALSTILLFIGITIGFTAINLAIFKTDAESFQCTDLPGWFAFFHYSFNMMFFSSTREIAAAKTLSYSAQMAQEFCVLLLFTVFISQIWASEKQKITEELDSTIATINASSKELERFILNEYKLQSIDEAISEIWKLEGSFVKILLFLTEKIKY